MDIDTIYNIAVDCREWAVEEFGSYFGDDLACTCAIVSTELHRRYQQAKIESKIACVETPIGCHCFLIVGCYLVDITASQFGREDVCFYEWDDRPGYWWWGSSSKVQYKLHKFETAGQLLSYQLKKGWPTEQLAIDKKNII